MYTCTYTRTILRCFLKSIFFEKLSLMFQSVLFNFSCKWMQFSSTFRHSDFLSHPAIRFIIDDSIMYIFVLLIFSFHGNFLFFSFWSLLLLFRRFFPCLRDVHGFHTEYRTRFYRCATTGFIWVQYELLFFVFDSLFLISFSC